MCKNLDNLMEASAEIHHTDNYSQGNPRRSMRRKSTNTSKLWSDPIITEAHSKMPKLNRSKTDTSKKKLKMRRLTKPPRKSDVNVDDSMTAHVLSHDSSKLSIETSLEQQTSSVIASNLNNIDEPIISKVHNTVDPVDPIEIDIQPQEAVAEIIGPSTSFRQVAASNVVKIAVPLGQQEDKKKTIVEHNELLSNVDDLPTEDPNKRGFGYCYCCSRRSIQGRNDGKLESLNVKIIFKSKSEAMCANLVMTGENICVRHIMDNGVTVDYSAAKCSEAVITHTSEGQNIISTQQVLVQPKIKQTVEATTDKDPSAPTQSMIMCRNLPVDTGTIATVNTRSVETLKNTSDKNTASEDTVSGPFKITASMEKEMSREMNCANDKDIFSGSVVEGTLPTQHNDNLKPKSQVSVLKHKSGSGIITQRSKRSWKALEEVPETSRKKNKNATETPEVSPIYDISFRSLAAKMTQVQRKNPNSKEQDSDATFFDEVTNAAFANIDADLEEEEINKRKQEIDKDDIRLINDCNIREIDAAMQKSKTISENGTQNGSNELIVEHHRSGVSSSNTSNINVSEATKKHKANKVNKISQDFPLLTQLSIRHNVDSENLFSFVEKTTQKMNNSDVQELKATQLIELTTQEKVVNLLTPRICQDLDDVEMCHVDEEAFGYDTPKMRPHDESNDSDGIIEATPEKSSETLITSAQPTSLSADVSNSSMNETVRRNVVTSVVDMSNKSSRPSQPPKPKRKISDNVERENMKPIDTPLTITQFTNQIQHRSTPLRPLGKKSLDFGNQQPATGKDSPEPLSDSDASPAPAKTTMEKEMMEKAFESTPHITPVRRQISTRRQNKINLACSLLSPGEQNIVKLFARKMNWGFLGVYSPELTHLIVKVNELNRANRSVKYMCAVASGKWIVSFNWIKECIDKQTHCDEIPYEVLDMTGDNGPYLSRVSKRKLFAGITFYCVPPFNTIDVKTFESILVSSGGRVVQSIQEVSVCEVAAGSVALALVDPACTEEDHTYTAMQYKVVPVVSEWVFNCLGTYGLHSVRDSLLCPATIVPFDRLNWPERLVEESNTEISL